MIFIYHPDAATMTAYALRQWLASTLADVLSTPPADREITTPPSAGALLDLGLPDYPWQFEPRHLTDDRETQGGVHFSRLRAIRRQGTLNFSSVPGSVIPHWRAWHTATQGGRLPFIAQLPDLAVLPVLTPGDFPLSLVRLERWRGALNLIEAL